MTGVVLKDMHEIDNLPDLSVVLDRHGDAWQYRGGVWSSYETASISSEKLAKKFGPITLLEEKAPTLTPNTPDRYALAEALHDGPNAQQQYRAAGIAPHAWEDCAYQEQYLADAGAGIAAGFHRSEVAEPTAEKIEWPDHWTTNEKLRDLHARWHDQSGNLIEVCEWKGCEFWEAAKFTLRLADVRVIGREPQGQPSAEVIGEWFTSSHGVAVAAVAPMTDRGPAVMVDGRVISPNDVAALVEFKTQGEPSDEVANAVARAIIEHDEDRHACYDHPEDFCCPCGEHGMSRSEWQRHRARAALRAASAAKRENRADD